MYFFFSWKKIKDYQVPSKITSASLLPAHNVFVCGGDDFKMYKYNYTDGTELGMYYNSCSFKYIYLGGERDYRYFGEPVDCFLFLFINPFQLMKSFMVFQCNFSVLSNQICLNLNYKDRKCTVHENAYVRI